MRSTKTRTYGIKMAEVVPFYFWLVTNGYKVDVIDQHNYYVLLTGRWYLVPRYGYMDKYLCAVLHKAKKEGFRV